MRYPADKIFFKNFQRAITPKGEITRKRKKTRVRYFFMRNPHMKFQDFSFNGLKVTVGTKSVTHAPTHARSKSNMPHQLFQSWGHKNEPRCEKTGFLQMRKQKRRSATRQPPLFSLHT